MTSDSPEITQLLSDLRSPDRYLAQSAEVRLAALGEAAVGPLCRTLLHPDDTVKSRAAQVLARIRSRTALGPLKEALSERSGPAGDDLRGILARAIADLVGPQDQDLVPFLSGLLRSDPDLFVRAAAADSLGRIGDSSGRPALQAAQRDTEMWVREAASRALATLDARAALEMAASVQGQGEVAEDAEAVALGRELASASEGPSRDRALEALLGRGFRALPVLLSLLGEPRKSVRLAAYRGLGRLRDRRALSALLSRVEDSSLDVEERALGTRALAALLDGRDTDKVPLLSRLVRADDRFIRAAAVAGLVRVGNPAARELVLRAIEDQDPFVREGVARSLAAKGDASWGRDAAPRLARAIRQESEAGIIAPMLRALSAVEPAPPLSTGLAWSVSKEFLSHEHAAVRLAALSVAVDHAPEGSAEFRLALSRLLLDEVRDVRVVALRACLGAGLEGAAAEAAGALRGFLADSDPEVVKDAVQVLGKLGDRASVELLISLLRSPDTEVAALARQALQNLDPRGPVRVHFSEDGRVVCETVLRCQRCATELTRKEQDEKELLLCPSCSTEHVLARGGRPVAISDAPFGVCSCATCRRRSLLVWEEERLVCPVSGEGYVRAQNGRVLRIRDLPFGICSCCGREAQPLERVENNRVICPRSGREHTLREGRYQLSGSASTGDVDAVNRALLAGTLSLTQSGLPADDDDVL